MLKHRAFGKDLGGDRVWLYLAGMHKGLTMASINRARHCSDAFSKRIWVAEARYNHHRYIHYRNRCAT